MAGSFLHRRWNDAFLLQFINQFDDLGEKFDQTGSGTAESSITLSHRLPLRALSFWNHPHTCAALFRNRQHPTLVQLDVLTTTTVLPAFSAQVVAVPANHGAALLYHSEQFIELPMAVLKLFPKLAGVHICTFIFISAYRFAQKTGPRNIFLKILQDPCRPDKHAEEKWPSDRGISRYQALVAACPSPLSELQKEIF